MATGASSRTLKVSGLGDVIVEAYHNTTAVSTSQYWQHPEMKSNPRIRLLGQHAKRLQEEVGQTYGRRDAEGDAFVVIDVLPSPGVPELRFVFSTRQVYLSMPPHLVAFLVGEMLLPEIKLYQVQCTNPWAGNASDTYEYFGSQWTNETAKNLAISEIFQQIHLALRPIWDQEFLRGQLVLVTEHGMLAPSLRTWKKDVVTGNWEEDERYENTAEVYIRVGFLVSVVISSIAAVLLVYHSVHVGKFVLKRAVRNEELKIRLVRLAENAKVGESPPQPSPHETAPQKCAKEWFEAKDHETLREEADKATGSASLKRFSMIANAGYNPFIVPQTLLTMFITWKLRSEITNSLDRFVHDCCILEKDIKVKDADKDGKVSPIEGEKKRRRATIYNDDGREETPSSAIEGAVKVPFAVSHQQLQP